MKIVLGTILVTVALCNVDTAYGALVSSVGGGKKEQVAGMSINFSRKTQKCMSVECLEKRITDLENENNALRVRVSKLEKLWKQRQK